MKITMKRLVAMTGKLLEAGKTYEVSDMLGNRLVGEGSAVEVKPAAPAAEGAKK